MIDENASDEDREGSCDSESENDRVDCCDNRLDDNLEKESKDDLEDGVISVFSEDTIDLKQDIQQISLEQEKKYSSTTLLLTASSILKYRNLLYH
jgi:hypothetical protein